jgi:hypothetical protein
MRMLKLIISLATVFLFLPWLVTPALGDPDIDVSPQTHDFGNVMIGTASTAIINISNVGGHPLELYGIDLLTGNTDYSITSKPSLPAYIPILNGSPNYIDVEITFAPTAEGLSTENLQIHSNDPDEYLVLVPLAGEGVPEEPPPPESIADILAFFDESVAGGSLYGNGPGRSGEARKKALRNMIEAAGDLIDDGYTETACWQLLDAYERCDGLFPPPDFVNGPAAATLRQMILDLMGELGC